jgi:hypothetical protein
MIFRGYSQQIATNEKTSQMNQTAANGFLKSTTTPVTTMGISDAKTRTGSSGTQSFA